MNASYYHMKVIRESDAWRVSLAGDIDYAASIELAPELAEVVENCETELLFDLGEVTLIDSEGIKALMVAYGAMRDKDGRARVVNCSQAALRVLHLVGVDDMLGISVG
jgi:anti-anti-sigma factor